MTAIVFYGEFIARVCRVSACHFGVACINFLRATLFFVVLFVSNIFLNEFRFVNQW